MAQLARKVPIPPPLTQDERYILNQWRFWTAKAQRLKSAEDTAMQDAGVSGRPYNKETYEAIDKAKYWQAEFDKENAKPVNYGKQ